MAKLNRLSLLLENTRFLVNTLRESNLHRIFPSRFCWELWALSFDLAWKIVENSQNPHIIRRAHKTMRIGSLKIFQMAFYTVHGLFWQIIGENSKVFHPFSKWLRTWDEFPSTCIIFKNLPSTTNFHSSTSIILHDVSCFVKLYDLSVKRLEA